MKSAQVACPRSVPFLVEVERAATRLGKECAVYDCSLQISNESGHLLTAFGDQIGWRGYPEQEEGLRALLAIDPSVSWVNYSVECRWESLFCEVIREMANSLDLLYVIDANGVLFSGAEVDPETLLLG